MKKVADMTQDERNRQKERVNKHYQENKTYYREKARKWTVKRRIQIREFIDNIKDVPCLDCGNKYPPCVMQFDHVNGEKEFNVGDSVRHAYSEEKILSEISKCEVICSNCHAIRTDNRRKIK